MADAGGLVLVRRWLLAAFGRLPRPVRIRLVRAIAPSHTVGCVCLIEHDGRLLVLRQHHRRGWTLPGGLVNRGEDAQRCVVREVKEETGLDVEVGLPIATVVEPRTRRVDVVFHVAADHEPAVVPGSEASGAQWLRPEDMGELDEPTATVLGLLERWRSPSAHSGRVR